MALSERELAKIPGRVTRGIAYLDKREKPGWRGRIDLDRLDLHSCTDCVLGQLRGHYNDARVKWGMSGPTSKRLGFNISRAAVDQNRATDYWHALTAEWKKQLTVQGGMQIV